MLDATYQYLADRGFSRGEARANTGALSDACIAEMLERVVDAPELDVIQERGLLAPELRDLVLGVPDDEEVEADLDEMIGRLVARRGLIQDRLEDGLVLCAARVNRTVSGHGNGEATVSRVARFLSDKPDVIEAFFCIPEQDGIVRKAQKYKADWDLIVQRHPEMEPRRRTFLSKTQQRLQLELGEDA